MRLPAIGLCVMTVPEAAEGWGGEGTGVEGAVGTVGTTGAAPVTLPVGTAGKEPTGFTNGASVNPE